MRYLLLQLFFSFFVLLLFGFPNQVSATVGGPFILEDLKYDAAENKMYFFAADAGGAGFQPSLIQYDPSTKKFVSVFVDEFLFSRLPEEEQKSIRFTTFEEAKQFLTGLDPLPRISLAKNNITIEISLSQEYDLEYRENMWSYLEAELKGRVLQNGEEIGSVRFYDCGNSIAFEGFVVPGSNQLLLLTNNIGICFETGYTVDRLFSIPEFSLIDSTILPELKDEREWEGGRGPSLSKESLVVVFDIESEERYTRLKSFADEAYQDGKVETAAAYLTTVYAYCCLYQEVGEDKKKEYYPIVFEFAAIQSERGEIDGYLGTVSILENLLAQEDGETQEFYKQKVLADSRFASLRNALSEEDFDALFEVSKQIEDTREGEAEVPVEVAQEIEEGDVDKETAVDASEKANFLPMILAGIFLILIIIGAVVLWLRRNRLNHY